MAGCSSKPSIQIVPTSNSKSPTIRLSEDAKSFEVANLEEANLAKLSKVDWNFARWAELFTVQVIISGGCNDDCANYQLGPALAGTYSVRLGILRFEPQFAPVRGVRYLAKFDSSWLPDGVHPDKAVYAELVLPKLQTAPTVVADVYPTRNVLPENLLKFYIHFSAPMSRGEAYEHIKLLDGNGKPIEGAFLELGEELWDPAGKRFTLLFDPGRIKHGLKPREDLGPVLEAGKSYTLVIGKGWHDANGEPLKAEFRKPFKVGPQFDKPVDPKSWKVQAPAGKNEPLVATLPRPHDHALLLREVWVADGQGRPVVGTPVVSDEETRWQFTPDAGWKPGTYRLVAKMTLEDLAGNKVGRLFEVDEFGPVQKEIKAPTIELPFEVGGAP
jgi:hypothetical protein